MRTTATPERVIAYWRCEACALSYASAVACECPLCGARLAPRAAPTSRPVAAALRLRHDRAAFATAALAHLAGADAVSDDIVASFSVPADLAPLYVPFRRVRGSYQARYPAGAAVEHVRGHYDVDVCVAAGLDEREACALEAGAGGRSAEDFTAATPAGPVLLDELGDEAVGERADRLLRERLPPAPLGCTDQVVGEQYYLVPVWVLTIRQGGQALRLVMDASSGRLSALAPAGVESRGRSRLEVLGHWAWLPTLFCALLALLIEVPVVRVALGVLGVATLVGGYGAARLLRRALGRARQGLATTLRASPHDAHRLEADVVRGRLAAVHRAVGWLPGIYAGIAVGAHLGLTAYVADRAMSLQALEFGVATLVPWVAPEPNLRFSPLAPRASDRDALATTLDFTTRPAAVTPHPLRGRLLVVGHGAYRDLAAAVAAAAPGDTIRVPAGRYDGPRLSLDKDLAIEGQGAVTFVWNGGRGPFVRIGGHGTRVQLAHLRFEAHDIQTAVIGDPTPAYGEGPAGTDQQVVLREVTIEAPHAVAVYSRSPGARYLIEGGQYSGAGAAIVMAGGGELAIRPYHGVPTRISTDEVSGGGRNVVGLSVQNTGRLTVDRVLWSGTPSADVAIEGDALAVDVGRAAEPRIAQRVLLLADNGAVPREMDLPSIDEPLHFSVEQGELRFGPPREFVPAHLP